MQTQARLERSSTITTKGQVTIPAEVRRILGVGPHDRVSFVVEDNQVRLQAAEGVVARTAGALRAYAKSPGPSAEDERRLFEEEMARGAIERAK